MRASNAVLVFSTDGKRQPDFDTLMQEDDLNKVFPDTAKSFYRIQATREDVRDCSTQELYKKILLGEIGDITVTFDVSQKNLTVLIAYLYSVAAEPTGTNPYTHTINELPVDAFQPTPFSMIHGFRGVADPLILRGCTMNSLTISARARGKLTATANIKFAEATEATGFTLPACQNEVALRMGDCQLLKGATNFSTLKTLRSFEYSFSNNLLTGEHAFTDSGTKPTRLERADQRTRSLKYSVLGDDKAALFLAALAGSEEGFTLHIGPVGNRVSIICAQAFHELDGGGLVKDGEAGETNIPVVATPQIVSGNSNSPTYVTAVNDKATAYLLASEA